MRGGKRSFDRLASVVGSRYGALLLVLVAALTAFPFFGGYAMVRWILALILLAVIAAALRAISGNRQLYHTGWVIGIPTVTVSILSRLTDIDWAYPLGAGLRVVFFGYLILVIFGDIWGREKITTDALMGACCVYLLLGLAWGSTFTLMEALRPGSFHIPSVPPPIDASFGRLSTESSLEYYSLITMTTVGYGDITPRSPAARTLAALEGLMAQLYLAIILARLVSLEIAQRLRGKNEKR